MISIRQSCITFRLQYFSVTRMGIMNKAVITRQSFAKSRHLSSLSSTTTTVVSDVNNGVNRPVAYWLFGMAGLVAGMVTVGGITRLTRSGLSMTDWKLQGSLPPMTREQWVAEFDRYKQFPEYQQRKSMSLDEFKFIYFWEYGHRMMGRMIGVCYTLPAIYFVYSGRITRKMYPRFGALFLLGGTQGLIGWWMVKSGLEKQKDLELHNREIRVSPYRLATHLSIAFTTYTLLLWTAFDHLNTQQVAKKFATTLTNPKIIEYAKKIRKFGIVNGLLVATTILSGAYVAGNDAGRAYNSFPMMNDHWIPPEILELTPIWKNFFENTCTVQFDHRILALTTLASITSMYTIALKSSIFSLFPVYTRYALHGVAAMAITQVSLGIATLLLYVPIPLAATHQAGSLVLLTIITGLVHSLNFSRHVGNKSAIFNNLITKAFLYPSLISKQPISIIRNKLNLNVFKSK